MHFLLCFYHIHFLPYFFNSNFPLIQDYDLVPKQGQCCGECIRKRCTFENTTYEIGDMWKSSDKCQFYECSANVIADNITEAKIVSYRKSCPELKDCPTKQVITKDCCMSCALDQQPANQSEWDDFVHWSDKYDDQMSKDTYLKHPCRRDCIVGATPKVCQYIFVVCILWIILIILLKTMMRFKESFKMLNLPIFRMFSIFRNISPFFF